MVATWDTRPLDAPFGIEIDADFSQPFSAGQRAELRELLYRHELICARRQTLSPAQHVALMECIGNVPGTSDTVGYISNVRPDGGLGNTEIAFHSDLAFTTHPYRAISLYAVDVVNDASSTLFASGTWAYRQLSSELRERIADFTVRHVYGANYRSRNRLSTLREGEPWAIHPLVWEHPFSGAPILYIHHNQSDRILELEEDASEALLAELFEIVYQPCNRYEHRWQMGDVLIWDNLALQHARGDVSAVGNRTLHRAVVADKSYYELCPMKTEQVEQEHAREYARR